MKPVAPGQQPHMPHAGTPWGFFVCQDTSGMSNHKSPAANGNTVPTYLPLPEAARKYNISVNVLTRMIRDGRIDAAQLPSGELLVSDLDMMRGITKQEIIKTRFAHLRGKPISAYAASQEHGIPHQTFIRWARAGYIQILKEEDRLLDLDAADVAYCAYVYETKKLEYGGKISGAKIFDEQGNPYQVKYPELSVKRRQTT